MISLWWLAGAFVWGLFCGYNSGYYYGCKRCEKILISVMGEL